jgi:hypothetical protein
MKQIKSLIPEEIHPPFMNFMGPGTKIEDRLSLNYKGKKGTKNYFLPTTYSDLVSFEHDLLYWSPNNIVRAYADSKFLIDIRSVLGLIGIFLQYTKRLGIEGVFNYATASSVLKGIKNIKKDISEIYSKGKDYKESYKEMKTIKKMYDNVNRQLGDRPFIEAPAEIQRDILQTKMDMDEIKNWATENNYQLRNKIFFNLLPKLLFTGYFIAPRLINSVKEIYESFKTIFIKNPEYEEIQKNVDKVKDKYVKYLNEIGEFKEAPFSQNLLRGINHPDDGEMLFKIKNNINKEKAKNLYIDFFDEFVEYQKYMNNKYKGVSGYEPFIIKELNKDNINKVFDIENVPSSIFEVIEDISKIDFDYLKKNKQMTDEKQKELKDEIKKVLKGEIDIPFETPAPKPLPTIEEDDDDIPIDISEQIEYIEGDDETIIVMPDDIKREITAILEKRQEKPFETSAGEII